MKRNFFILFTFFTLLAPFTLSAQHQIERTTEVYAIKGQDTLLLDIYLDKILATQEARPVMIYVHGGAWSAGSRKNAAQQMFCQHLAETGIVSVAINYRLGLAEGNIYGAKNMTEVVRLGTEDIIDATLYLLSKKEELNINSDQIMLSGGSAGAINSLTLEYDICNDEPYTHRLPEGFNYAGIISQAGCIEILGNDLHWDKTPCPMLLMHGDLNGVSDGALPIVKGKIEVEGMNDHPWGGTLYIDSLLNEILAPHWTYIERGADHCIAMKTLTDNHAETDQFIQEYVLGKRDCIKFTDIRDKEPVSMNGVENMVKFAPLYILGFGKYLEEIDWNNMQAPSQVVY